MPGREELSSRQAALVTALVAGGRTPPGLDTDRVRAQAAVLLRKRGRSVAHAQPDLAWSLGESFWPAFRAYAAGRPRESCAADDAVRFARYLLDSPHARDRQVRRTARRVTRAGHPPG